MGVRDDLAKDGYFVARGVLTPTMVEEALDRLRVIAAQAHRYAPHLHQMVPVAEPALQASPDPLDHYDWIDNITFFDRTLWRLVAAAPALLALARTVLDSADVYPTNGGGMFMKPPGSGAGVPWHQDASPFSDLERPQQTVPPVFDFWLGLSPATVAMGCLHVIPGSHKRGRLAHIDGGGILKQLDLAEHGYSPADAVALETEPGDAVIWHQDLIHGSPPNTSQRRRVAVASVYHGAREEAALRRHHRKGAIRRRPPLCRNGVTCDLVDALPDNLPDHPHEPVKEWTR